MAHLADTINDGKGPQPVSEKIRCLGAVREMIKLSKSYVSNGLPQVISVTYICWKFTEIFSRFAHVYDQPYPTEI